MIRAICEILATKSYGSFKMKGGLLYNEVDGHDVIVVPRNMHKQIIGEAHNDGHYGAQRTIHNIKQKFWIPHVEPKVKQLISNFRLPYASDH